MYMRINDSQDGDKTRTAAHDCLGTAREAEGWREGERDGVRVRDLRSACMPELLADFKVAYATTEARLRVDVRMFSLT